jgi:membrane fusion protein, multidrug efflux system
MSTGWSSAPSHNAIGLVSEIVGNAAPLKGLNMRKVLGTVFLIYALSCPAIAQQQPSTAVPVGVVRAERKPVARAGDYVGRVEAISRVEIRARITGYLEEVLFREGDRIKEGAPLYRIEKGLFQAQVLQVEGALKRSRAAKALSALQLGRAEELLDKQAGSVVSRDQARALDQQNEGAVMADEASLATAKINLGYTDIIAPITGKVGRTNITKGNVVSPGSGPQTVIVSQDPMYVTFPVSQREFLRAQARGEEVDISDVKARLHFADGRRYQQEGSINFVDVQVDRGTDTIPARAIFPNPDGTLVDGQFVRIEVENGKPDEKVVVPQAALIADQEGVYVFTVEDGKTAIKRVKTGGETDTGVVIDQGLMGGELVIVEGLMLVHPGTEVRATPSRALSGS